jgi:hypothetical protein
LIVAQIENGGIIFGLYINTSSLSCRYVGDDSWVTLSESILTGYEMSIVTSWHRPASASASTLYIWLWLLAQMGETRRILKHFGAGFLSRTFADHDQGPLGNEVTVLGDFDATGVTAAGAGFETGA